MRIGIVSQKDGWHIADLLRAAAARGHDATRIAWSDLRAAVATSQPGAYAGHRALDSLDVVLPRAMPAASLEQVIFRMDALHHLEAAGVRIINPPRAIECAVDKYLALSRIQAAGLPVPATIACQSPQDALAAFDALSGDVVLKPLFGSEGFGLMRLTDRAAAQRVFHALARLGSVLYLQKFISIREDLRLFVIDGVVIGAMRRVGDAWPGNIARGGRGEACQVGNELADLALCAARACCCLVAGVDILLDPAGHPFVLEVNAAPGWRELSRVCELDIADRVIALAESQAGALCHA